MTKLKLLSLFVSLALMTALPVRGEGFVDSLQVCIQAGDSCMQQFNTFEALNYYQKAYEQAKTGTAIRIKLADCYYKRANYREASDLLKNVPEDSLSHEAFRQLALSYQKQDDNDSFIYWAEQLVNRYPMDGEMVAGLTRAYARNHQPENGLRYGLNYYLHDSKNILVNRAVADAFFLERDFIAASEWYNRLLEQGDSTFNTLYSAGMCYSQTQDLERAYKYLQLAFLISGMQHYGCAYRLGVICVDTKRHEEGLGYLSLARELMLPDTAIMKAITLSQAEGYYMTERYDEAVAAWKEHLTFNPSSVATYYNIANTYVYLLNDREQAKEYYEQFLEIAREIEDPTPQLTEMTAKAKEMLELLDKVKQKMEIPK